MVAKEVIPESHSDRRLVFWARHNNDIDHVTPIVWELATAGDAAGSIEYYVLNPWYQVDRSDPRLETLAEHGVELTGLPVRQSWESALLQLYHSESDVVGWAVQRLVRRLFPGRKDWTVFKDAVARIVDATPPGSVFVFDHNVNSLTKQIVTSARHKSITCVSVPHGLILFYEHPAEVATGRASDASWMNLFDYVVMPNQFSATKCQEVGLEAEKTVVLGSARFCPEWMRQLEPIFPAPRLLPTPAGELKVLYLIEKWEENLDLQMKTLQFLADEPGLCAIAKKSTRGIRPAQAKAFRKLRMKCVGEEHPTPALIAWADVVVAAGTSVIVDPLMRGKPVVTMTYLDSLTYVYDEYDVTLRANSFEAFQATIRSLKSERPSGEDANGKTDRFVRDFVNGGEGGPVLTRYREFLEGLMV